MATLVGRWEATQSSGRVVQVVYRVVANDSVLVEDFTTASGKSTMTVYHVDGGHLVATHYCGQRNQPRLRAVLPLDGSRLGFLFWDATNLSDRSAAHLHGMEILLVDAGRFEKKETYVAGGEEATETLRFVRKP